MRAKRDVRRMTTLREHLTRVLEGLDSTIHVGSPRSPSVRVCLAEVPDAVEAILVELSLDGNHPAPRDGLTIEETFAHIPDADKAQAVEGFVTIYPWRRGIDFYTMMEMLLDADAHLPIIGDVIVEGDAATRLVTHFRRIVIT